MLVVFIAPVRPITRGSVALNPALPIFAMGMAVGSLATARVPLEMFVAFVVSVVALGAKEVPLVFVHVMAPVLAIVQSPLRATSTGKLEELPTYK
jgi:hypothetical protein